ncbi:MAG: FAD-dependent oxidoreductase [Desulfobacterales bacterium]|jgi:NADPH-dependent 2,4-dienoyl-CoA reductase/sulfur reductase-like enzyme/rhodanese-related sulfurtransferase
MSPKLRVLIIGGVACGPKTGARLMRLMPEAEVTMLEKGALVSYGACGLPYYVEGVFSNINALTHTPAGVSRTPEFFSSWKGFKTLTRTEAIAIHREDKMVRVRDLESGREEDLPYDKLVLATGGQSFRPPIPGLDLENVWFMTHPDDAAGLVAEIERQGLKKAVLVGAGFIGLEVAEALINRGLEVTMVEMADQIMPGILDEDIARLAQIYLDENDVELVLGETVTALEGDRRVQRVVTDKQRIAADFVVVGVGTRPNDQLARAAGLRCQNGILVNEFCQTSDPDIYAGGDCVPNAYVRRQVGNPLYVPLGSTANKHGRVIADHIAGKPTPFNGITCTSVVRVFDYTLGRTGLTERMARNLGIDYEVTTWTGQDIPHYMTESRLFAIKMIASRRDRKLLGVQVAGMGNGAKRLDVAASVIYFGGTLDQLADIDFGYAPPYSPPIDPLAVCAHVLTNKLDGLAAGIPPLEAKKLMDTGDCLLLDVRIPDESKMEWIPHTDIRQIPLSELRSRVSELPRDRDILTYCKVSMRGYEAQRILNAAGIERVRFIEGGVAAWPFETAMPGL